MNDALRDSRRRIEDIEKRLQSLPLRMAVGGGGGSTAKRAVVYDDLAGYERDGVTIGVATSRCLPLKRSGSASWAVDLEATVIDAEPVFGVRVELKDDGCGCNGTIEPRFRITWPITEDNIVTNTEAAALVIAGTGADPSSTIEVSFIPSVTGQPFPATVSADGSWTTEAINTTSAPTGIERDVPVVVVATEIDVDEFIHKPAILTYTRAVARAVVDGAHPDLPTAGPDLIAASDTGVSDLDNRTAELAPTFRVQNTVSYDATGPVPRLYANGILAAEGAVLGPTSFAATDIVELTPAVDLVPGIYAFTYTLVSYSPGTGPTASTTQYESGHSPATRVIIATDPVSTTGSITATSVTSEIVYKRIEVGPLPTSVPQPETPISGADNASINLTFDVETRLWGVGTAPPITATAKAVGPFETTTNPIPIDEVEVTNLTPTDPIPVTSVSITNNVEPPVDDPPEPDSVPQPVPLISLEEGDPVPLVWDGTAWQVRRPDLYARECLLQTVGGVQTIVQVGPCPMQWTSAEKLKLDGGL